MYTEVLMTWGVITAEYNVHLTFTIIMIYEHEGCGQEIHTA